MCIYTYMYIHSEGERGWMGKSDSKCVYASVCECVFVYACVCLRENTHAREKECTRARTRVDTREREQESVGKREISIARTREGDQGWDTEKQEREKASKREIYVAKVQLISLDMIFSDRDLEDKSLWEWPRSIVSGCETEMRAGEFGSPKGIGGTYHIYWLQGKTELWQIYMRE